METKKRFSAGQILSQLEDCLIKEHIDDEHIHIDMTWLEKVEEQKPMPNLGASIGKLSQNPIILKNSPEENFKNLCDFTTKDSIRNSILKSTNSSKYQVESDSIKLSQEKLDLLTKQLASTLNFRTSPNNQSSVLKKVKKKNKNLKKKQFKLRK